MSRKQNKHHYIYKTTCNITGKFYVGMHSSYSLDDGYLGSGKILGYSIKKYGIENHSREILEYCVSREKLKSREKEIVNEQLLSDPLNINLKYGGEGGGAPTQSGFWNEQHKLNFTRAGWKAMNLVKDKSLASKKSAATFKKRYKEDSYQYMVRIDSVTKATMKASSKESCMKRNKTFLEREHQKGINNSCYGKIWITDGIKPIKINKDDLEKYLVLGYSRGRKRRTGAG